MKKPNNLICFTGRKRSGKDWLLQALQKEGGDIRRLSFSDELRVLANKVYPWLPKEIGDVEKDLPFVHQYNPNGLTPRQIWGVINGLREVQDSIFLDNFVANQYPEVLANPDVLYIISDLRTPPEHKFISSIGCPIVKITRCDRTGIEENPLEDYIDEIIPTHEFINNFNGAGEFIEFMKLRGLV